MLAAVGCGTALFTSSEFNKADVAALGAATATAKLKLFSVLR